jgi:hypothetical protein
MAQLSNPPHDKYDIKNYIKHPSLTLQNADFAPLGVNLSSANLFVKWSCSKVHIIAASSQNQPEASSTVITLTGTCEKRVNTPIGLLFPEQYNLKIAVDNNKFIEPLQLINIDYEYSLFFQNPPNVRMSQVEVWEFKE